MKKPVKIIIAILIVLIVGGVIGYWTAMWAYDPLYKAGAVKNGPWMTNLTVGSREAGLHIKAVIAMTSLLALTKSEAVYYQAEVDDSGKPLSTKCIYRIDGKELDARWWSITLYGEDNFLIPNEKNIYSYNMDTVNKNSDGSYSIYLSSTPREQNWLPSGSGDQKIALLLRLYNPGPTVYANPGGIELPHIVKEACR